MSCSNCSHVWFADPRDALPDPQPAQPPAAPAGYPPQQQMYAQPAYGAPPPAQPPQPAPMAAPPAPEPAAMPAPPPPEPADEPEPIPEPEPAPEAAEDDGDMGVLPNDIDDMFEDDEDIEPFESLINNDDEEDDLESIESPDQMEDPDYIPDVFTADEQEPDDEMPKKGIIGKIIALFFILLIAGLVAGTFFFKDELVAKVPQLKDVFEKIGFHQVGAGLQIQRVEAAQETDQGLEVLVIRGQIENVDTSTRPVPLLRALLLDSAGEEIQHADTAPLKSELKKGEKMSFKIRVKEPSPLRRRFTVKFIDPKDAAKGGN